MKVTIDQNEANARATAFYADPTTAPQRILLGTAVRHTERQCDAGSPMECLGMVRGGRVEVMDQELTSGFLMVFAYIYNDRLIRALYM